MALSSNISPCSCGGNGDGWQAQLAVEITCRGGKSVISDSRQRGPLTIQHPFYPEGDDLCHLYLLHPPAGVVGGDRLQLELWAKERGQALMTTPGATKFYKSNGLQASQRQQIVVASDSTLEWLPQETIYYPDTNALMATTVELEDGAHFLGWEIHCLGLPATGKTLADGRVHIVTTLSRKGRLLLREAFQIGPENGPFQAALLRGCSVFGTFLATGCDEDMLEKINGMEHEPAQVDWGVTLLDDLLVLRYLGDSVIAAKRLFIAVWQMLRPQLLHRSGCAPRIWAT